MADRRGWRSGIAAIVGLALAGACVGPPLAAAQSSQAQVAQTQTPPPSTGVQTEGPAAAPAVEETGPNTGRVAVSLGADWASAYYFRGIVQEQNGGNNVQPYAEVSIRLLEDLGPLTSLSIAPGIWNNFHHGGGLVAEPSDPKFWYEADIYLKLTATWWEVLSTSATYTYYVSPNDSFDSYADVGLGVELDDSKWLGNFALNPSILFAFETAAEALPSPDGKKGIYMGIGLAPGYTFFEGSRFPVTISAPMTFGFSVKDYYTVDGRNQTFGYFSGGPLITMPLTFIPASAGAWELKAGVQFLVLNSNLKVVNLGDGFVPIGTVGLSMTY